ncbi:MAG: hypothetical protein ABIJ09_02915 [Pseudomonadota bacterium]
MSWALAVAMPGEVAAYDAVIAVRNLRQALSSPDRLDASTREALHVKPHPEISLGAREAAVSAAERLLDAPLCQVGIGIATRDDDSLQFTAPSVLRDVQVSISHDGHYVAGAVARAALEHRLRVDAGQDMGPPALA